MNVWNSYICTADIHFKQMNDQRSNVLDQSSWEKQAWKNKISGLNRNRTHGLCDTSALTL